MDFTLHPTPRETHLGFVKCMKRISKVLALAVAPLLCFVSGCYERTTNGTESIYRCAAWTGPTIIGIGIVALLASWLLFKWNKGVGITIAIVTLFLVPLLAPSMYVDRVLVDDDHLESTYGFWFSPNVRSLRFEDLAEIRYVALAGYRGGTKYELHCLTHKGRVEVVHGGDLAINAFPEILERAKAKGVAVTLGR